MKYISIIAILAAPMSAQWIVNDPVNTAVNSAVQAGQAANHGEIMRQWAEQLERLNRQLRQLEDQLAVQKRIRDVMGDPPAAGGSIVLRELGMADLARQYGTTLGEARRLANAIDSLRNTSEGIYRSLDDQTVLGGAFTRQEIFYRRYAAVDKQADSLAAVERQAAERTTALQADIAATIEQLRRASTQAEVDKLNGKLVALTGQLAHIDRQREAEAQRLAAQHLLNENQAAKERQDLLERQLAEERQSLAVAAKWQGAMKVLPSNYTNR
jgi:hypothetical protein